MPKILIIKAFIFILYSADVAENRYHIHVEARKGKFRVSAKFWITPEVEMVSPGAFSEKEISQITKYIEQYKSIIIKQIEKFISGEKVTCIKK
ncbi:MAG: DUF4160 domain-containing protein [Bacteroidota bacterium]